MVALALAAVGVAYLTSAKPNIIYIMADDLGYGEVGAFGQKKIPTPNIDRIAAEGIRLTRSYSASAVCAPTRCSLLTGRHQGHAVIRGNKERGGFGQNDAEGQFPLPKSETTIAEVLKGAGYRTALVGKWGLGGPDPGETPMDHGFDRFYGYLCQRRAHNHYPPYLWSNHQPDLLGNPVFDAHQKIAAPLDSEQAYQDRYGGKQYAATKLKDACTDFIRQSKSGPFFLYYAPILPHLALQAPQEWIDRFPREWDSMPYLGDNGYLPSARPHATYAAMIAYLDFTVGEILKELDKNGLSENTLIIFTSDNGATFNGGVDRSFFSSNANLRDAKMSLYEGGIRVPFVARWPGRIKPGTSSDAVNVCFDAFTTLSDAAGAHAPKRDGMSYLPVLLGQPAPKRDYVYFEYPEASAMQAVMIGPWKVIRPNLSKRPDLVELYNIDTDPSESHNRASERPEIVRRGIAIMQKEHVPNKDFPLPSIDKKSGQS